MHRVTLVAPGSLPDFTRGCGSSSSTAQGASASSACTACTRGSPKRNAEVR